MGGTNQILIEVRAQVTSSLNEIKPAIESWLLMTKPDVGICTTSSKNSRVESGNLDITPTPIEK